MLLVSTKHGRVILSPSFTRLWHLLSCPSLNIRIRVLGLPSLEYQTITQVFFQLPTLAFAVVPSPFDTIQPLSFLKHLLMDCFYFVLLRHDKSAGICWAKLYFDGVQPLHHRPPSVEEHWTADTPRARDADVRQVLQHRT